MLLLAYIKGRWIKTQCHALWDSLDMDLIVNVFHTYNFTFGRFIRFIKPHLNIDAVRSAKTWRGTHPEDQRRQQYWTSCYTGWRNATLTGLQKSFKESVWNWYKKAVVIETEKVNNIILLCYQNITVLLKVPTINKSLN